MNPRVSICIPAFRQPDLFARALSSVLEQDFVNYEVIVTDDSDDDSVEKVVSSIHDSRVHYVRNDTRLGSPQNWNAGLQKATGDYLQIFHHDDRYSTKECLGKLVQLLDRNPQSSLAFCASIAETVDGKQLAINRPKQSEIDRLADDPLLLMTRNFIGAPSCVLVRQQNVKPFDRNLKWLVDIDWYISILSQKPGLSYIPEVMVLVCDGAVGQVTKECRDNPEVEVFENFYLYSKLAALGHVPPRYCFNLLLELASKYRLGTVEQLDAYRVDKSLAAAVCSELPWYRAKRSLRNLVRGIT